MQIDTTAPNATLAAAFDAIQAAIRAIESVDVSVADDAACELLRDRSNVVESELQMRGLRTCGRCRVSAPGAVDWGCVCSMTPEEQARDAADFARIHD